MDSNNSFRGDFSRGRFFAMVGPSLTFTVHTILFLLICLNVLPSASDSPFELGSLFSLYNAFAAVASLAGVVGAIRANRTLLRLYTLTHLTTLALLTLLIFSIFFPSQSSSPFPLGWFDERTFCREMDGFGDDEAWIARCSSRLAMLKTAVGIWVTAALAAQWWALREVWVWGRGLGKERGVRRDLETVPHDRREKEEEVERERS